jgi:signal transduction histidine kinase/ActR/RegA family two-component response regulator
MTAHAPLPMATVEGASHIVRYVNPAFCHLIDTPKDKLIGKPFREILPGKDKCVTLLDRVFRSGKPESHTEQEHSKTHPVFWSHTMWPVIANERPVGVMIQVTETAQLHEKTLAMNEALILGSVRQHELASDLARADRSKDEFLAMLAHELRNPLAPLRNASEILQTADASDDAREQAQHILERQIENMSRMIDDLLDVSRITEGKIELRKHVVALEAIIAAAASLVRPGISARGQELAITLPAEPVFLNADATRLDQVFGNLLANACKYSNSGSHISLSAERVAAHGKEPPEVIVRVRDDGMGIAPELLPRVFDLFVQATDALDRAHGGLGIGLTLVQRLVKMHGGSVEARSDGLGHGSEFIVRLPILPGASAAPPPPPPPPAQPARETSRRMLIVDDNEDSARSMSTLQRLRGHETRTAFTGPDAVAAAAEFAPEVVLLDIGLPGMDGYEVARRLRAMPALAGALLVAMSGYGSDEDRARAGAAGFDEYLVKPVDLDLLRLWLRSRLEPEVSSE